MTQSSHKRREGPEKVGKYENKITAVPPVKLSKIPCGHLFPQSFFRVFLCFSPNLSQQPTVSTQPAKLTDKDAHGCWAR